MKSIFDGWTKKIEERSSDNKGGYCAWGFVAFASGFGSAEYSPRMASVGRWIQDNLNPPEFYFHPTDKTNLRPSAITNDAIIWANNTKALDIEGFKMVDLLTQGYVPEESTEPVESEIHQ